MSIPVFRSCLAGKMTELVDFKRLQGYDYIDQAKKLRYFDRFLCERNIAEPRLTAELLESYVEHTRRVGAHTRVNRLSVTCVFSRFVHMFDPESAVLDRIPVRKPRLPRFYLYSGEDISALLSAALRLGPAGSLRPHCLHMLIGLLYVSGLRISEALGLDLGDLDLKHARLFVRRGKFGKERYVALDRSTVERLEAYLALRSLHAPDTAGAAVFVNSAGRRMRYAAAAEAFGLLRRTTGVGRSAAGPPRLHDLRHTYACNCLLKWRCEGADVNARLPLLATAMGHTGIGHTQIYLHVTSAQLAQTVDRLRNSLNNNTNRTPSGE